MLLNKNSGVLRKKPQDKIMSTRLMSWYIFHVDCLVDGYTYTVHLS